MGRVGKDANRGKAMIAPRGPNVSSARKTPPCAPSARGWSVPTNSLGRIALLAENNETATAPPGKRGKIGIRAQMGPLPRQLGMNRQTEVRKDSSPPREAVAIPPSNRALKESNAAAAVVAAIATASLATARI